MNKFIAILLLILSTLSFGAPAFADLQKGIGAWKSEDYAAAFKEFRPLAEQGNVEAQYWLSRLFESGRGVPEDTVAAIKWLTLAAEGGYAKAQNYLGDKYSVGNTYPDFPMGVEKDMKVAFKWWTRAAEQGYPAAHNNLGYAYLEGRSVTQDYIYAHMWFNITVSHGVIGGAPESRDDVAEKMTPTQIETAQRLARECVKKNYKDC